MNKTTDLKPFYNNSNIDDLMNIEKDDFVEALSYGNYLIQNNNPRGYKLKATVFHLMGNNEEALDIALDGILKFDDQWYLYHIAGFYHMLLENYEEAFEAYNKSLECKDVDEIMLLYYFASGLFTIGETNDAKKILSEIYSEDSFPVNTRKDIYLLILYLSFQILKDEREFQKIADNILENEKDIFQYYDEFPWEVLLIHNIYTRSLFEINEIKAAYNNFKALALRDKQMVETINTFNDYFVEKSNALKNRYDILIKGNYAFDDSGKVIYQDYECGFFCKYIIVAENLEEAMRFIKMFEADHIHDSIKIKEYSEIDTNVTEEKGVEYVRLGHLYGLYFDDEIVG